MQIFLRQSQKFTDASSKVLCLEWRILALGIHFTIRLGIHFTIRLGIHFTIRCMIGSYFTPPMEVISSSGIVQNSKDCWKNQPAFPFSLEIDLGAKFIKWGAHPH